MTVTAVRRPKGRPRRMTPDMESKMAEQYDGGASVRMIAASTGWSYGAVHAGLIRHGVQLRPRGGRHRR